MPDACDAVAVVVPAHRGGPALDRCLAALTSQTSPAEQLVVVADGPGAAADAALRSAVARAGARLVVAPEQGGPGAARNLGAEWTSAPLLFFVDSDVALAADAVARVRERLSDGDDAVFGSYDDQPADPGFTSQYKNLVHHLVHQRGRREAATFWGACGGVRRTAFAGVGGFDEAFGRPCVEDIELGYRLRRDGYRLTLDHQLRGTHLKRWTVLGLARTDFFDRAVPYSALILRSRVVVDDLGTETRSRLQVLATAAGVASLMSVPRSGRRGLMGAAAAGGAVIALDAALLIDLARLRGLAFAARCIPWRLVHQALSLGGLAVATVAVAAEAAGLRQPPTVRLRPSAELRGDGR